MRRVNMSRRGGLQKGRGFTLIEMVVGLAIAGILLAVAVPSFNSFIAGGQLRSTTTDLIIALNSARSSSVNYGISVNVAPSTGGWEGGWVVQYPAGFTAEQQQRFSPSGVAKVTSSGGAVTFNRQGFANTATFKVCHPKVQSQGREITVGPTGKVTNEQKACS